MANTNVASYQLMKPPKELASWKFPLSDILDNYFNSLPEASKIQYGEAALVIQNSVNAYVRRVEELYDETRSLNHKIIDNKLIEDKLTALQNGKKAKKLKIDFDDFQIYEFDKEIGKNINLKVYEGKVMKLLHRCFSQLENPHVNLATELFDVIGETIGRKYDFRCSQRLSKDGSLVEDFAPTDFVIVDILKDTFHNMSSIHNENVMRTVSSNTNSNTLTASNSENNECNSNYVFKDFSSNILQLKSVNSDSIVQINDTNLSAFRSSTLGNIQRHIPTFEIINNISVLPDDTDNVYYGYTNQKNDSSDEEIESEFREDTSYSFKTYIQCHERNLSAFKIKGKSLIPNINNLKDTKSSIILEHIKNKNTSNVEHPCEKTEIDSGLRRSKRLSTLIDPNFEYGIQNDNVLKPIPFQDGLPEKINKSRTEFRLPCHINLLKQVVKKPKRRMKIISHIKKSSTASRAHKRNPISNASRMVECANSPEDSSLNSELSVMKEEEANDVRKSCDNILSNKQEPVNFIPVIESPTDEMNVSQLDLRKHSNFKSFGPLSTTHFAAVESMPLAVSTFSNLTFPSTSNFVCLNSKNKDRIRSTNLKYKKKIGNYIKHKIQEIYEELNLHTDEDQKVAKWHEEIKPRLLAAEQKQPFRISEYESRILSRLETSDRKVQFDDIIREEPLCEVARYFSATLQLLFSNSVAAGLQYYLQLEKRENPIVKSFEACEATKLFTLQINNLFDVLNRSHPKEGIHNNSQDFETIREAINWLDTWEREKESDDEFLRTSTAEGLRVTLYSTLNLTMYLVQSCGFKYVLTSKMNQDCLEASTHNLDINTCKDLEKSIELILLD